MRTNSIDASVSAKLDELLGLMRQSRRKTAEICALRTAELKALWEGTQAAERCTKGFALRHFRTGQKVRVRGTDKVLTIENYFGPKFIPPYTVVEEGTLYMQEELEEEKEAYEQI